VRADPSGEPARRQAGRRRGALAAVLLLARLFSGRAAADRPAPGARGPADTVVLISLDGTRWDYPRLAGARSLLRMASEGGTALRGLVPPFPASTFPAHATLATGVHPDRHGIVNNEFLDRGRGLFARDDDASWLLAEPIWVTAERQGIRSAVFHWVGSYTPWRGAAASITMPYSASVPDAVKIDRVIAWLREEGSARPRLILAYLHGPDAAGHASGPASPSALEQARRGDLLIGRLLRSIGGLDRRIAVLAVSDHGMSRATTAIRLDRLLTGAARGARAVSSGGTSNLYCGSDPVACSAAASILERIPGVTVYRRDDLPADLRCRLTSRTGDLVAIASPGSYFAGGEPRRGPPPRGMHGYRPDEPEMRGIFYAWGAGIKPGATTDLVRAVDVVPLVCRLLGIEAPEGIDGRAPEDLLAAITPARRVAAPDARP